MKRSRVEVLPSSLRKLVPLFLFGTAAFVFGCVQLVVPEHAVNEAGTSHTITSTLVELPDSPLSEDFEEALIVSFEVIDGPNQGAQSADDCVPSCEITGLEQPVSWTYSSNGTSGLDSIRVCTIAEGTTVEETAALWAVYLDEVEGITVEDFLGFINDELGTGFETLEDLVCVVVTKQWIGSPQPFVPDPDPSQFPQFSTATPRPAPAPTATESPTGSVAGITPPTTGDGAMR